MRGRQLFTLLLIAGVYVAAGRLGLSLAYVHSHASAVWPPTGIALAACLALGIRVWPALFAGAFVVNFLTSASVVACAAIAAGNTLEAITGARLIERYARGRAALDTAPDTFRFALFGGVCATIIAAGVGSVTLVAAGLARPADVWSVALTWWVGDMVGAMLVAPPLLLWRSSHVRKRRHPVEILMLAVCVGGTSLLVFGPSPAGVRQYPLEFLTIGVLLWAAFRVGAFGTSVAAAVTSVIAVWGTLRGFGPFAGRGPNESLLLLQSFMGVVSMMTLAVAAEVAARRSASLLLRRANDSLEERVGSRTEELLKLHGRLAEAQAVAHVGSWEWEVPSNTLWWSDELHRIYGVPKESPASYEMFLARVHPDDRDRIDRTVRRAMADGQPFAFEHRIVRGDGSLRTLSARGHVTRDDRGAVVRMSGVGHDITELKQAEEERAALIREQSARREAEEANRAKDQFLATLSHELRTPMNAVLGWAQMLRSMPLDDEKRARAVDAIFRNVQIQSQLVSDILDVSRVAAGSLSIDAAPVNLAAVIDEAVETMREAAAAKHVAIEVRRPDAPLELVGDAVRLRQVVWNLVSNAVKFVQPGGHIGITVRCHPDHYELVVEDDGPGIAPEFLPHVFDRFRQADGSVTREHGGLGLGLALVRHITELHGGRVTASNRPPHGARFTVVLPVRGTTAPLEGTAVARAAPGSEVCGE